MRAYVRFVSAAALVSSVIALASLHGEAHKAITSPYTFNDDVFPIVRQQCSRCHMDGGVAPMSLMTHADAAPWAESMRIELLAGHMPPWRVDHAADRFRHAQGLTARELDILLTWAVGGTPIGSEKVPPLVELQRRWPLGPPDLTLELPTEFSLAADTQDATAEFTIATGLTEPRWLNAIDVLPGAPAIVRQATVLVKSPPVQGDLAAERVLLYWLPGDDAVRLPRGVAYRLPAGAEVVLRIQYRKTWQYDQLEMHDRSSVGLYFAAAPAKELHALNLFASSSEAVAVEQQTAREVTFSRKVGEDLRALAIYPDPALHYATVTVEVTRPDGTREDLIEFHPRPGWPRRYWFREPILLPRGTRIDVKATFDDEARLLPPGAIPPPAGLPDPATVRLTLNVVRPSQS